MTYPPMPDGQADADALKAQLRKNKINGYGCLALAALAVAFVVGGIIASAYGDRNPSTTPSSPRSRDTVTAASTAAAPPTTAAFGTGASSRSAGG
jgi:hypothetical protein